MCARSAHIVIYHAWLKKKIQCSFHCIQNKFQKKICFLWLCIEGLVFACVCWLQCVFSKNKTNTKHKYKTKPTKFTQRWFKGQTTDEEWDEIINKHYKPDWGSFIVRSHISAIKIAVLGPRQYKPVILKVPEYPFDETKAHKGKPLPNIVYEFDHRFDELPGKFKDVIISNPNSKEVMEREFVHECEGLIFFSFFFVCVCLCFEKKKIKRKTVCNGNIRAKASIV